MEKDEKIEKARVFKNGRSQAVRIPAEYRFRCDEVYIRRNANTGELILSEKPLTPSLDEIYARLDAARRGGLRSGPQSGSPDRARVDVTSSSAYILDTNTATYILSGRSQAARRSLKAEKEHSTVALSAITQAEILFGLEKKPEATRLRAAVEELFGTIQILAWDSQAAHAYGRLRAWMSASGKTLTAMDLLIAAHVIAAKAILVTHDKAFLQITPFLKMVDWATDLGGKG